MGMLWAVIILVSVGTGFFKGNVSGIDGRIFSGVDLSMVVIGVLILLFSKRFDELLEDK